ncbi:Cysteine--tRNA ligase [Astathelohania contejeani]|uniref:cysteine--tRNA ligase n=1 Tax=Astathelohania contejeani TaxID=164912 RepID=A0ABQ7HYQ1_9MICR|nr:Cysteine--tRNA ligase [Thelohania contejeani]
MNDNKLNEESKMEMPLQLSFFNSLTQSKTPFIPRKPHQIHWYVCGPTVYDSAHLGHARTYVCFDVIRRVLEEYFGYDVIYAMNITDIDDKIIKKAQELQHDDLALAARFITQKYEREFFEDMKTLGVRMPQFVTRVTDYIEKIVEYIDVLITKGYAYESEGSVYFNLSKYCEKFKHPILVNKEAIDEVEEESQTEKKKKVDFALWKKGKHGEPTYPSKWSQGRPGWHIECSVMAGDIFPEGLDIHSGGIDLTFPHHNNEIVQSQAYSEKEPWVNYFIHSGHLHIDGRKMSKSLKNFITIRELLKSYTPRQIRILFLLTNWWTSMTYSSSSIEYAVRIEKKIFTFLSIIEARLFEKANASLFVNVTSADRIILNYLEETKSLVHEALCDNINTTKTVNALLNLITISNSKLDGLSPGVINIIKSYIEKILRMLGLLEEKENKITYDEEVLALLAEYRDGVRRLSRSKAPHGEFFAISDSLRNSLKKIGYIIEDLPRGSRIRREYN